MLTYPMKYNKGKVDDKWEIIRIDRADDIGFYVYFRVKKTVYVGYGCRQYPLGMVVIDGKKAKNQDIKPIHEEYVVALHRTKAGRKRRMKLKHHTRQRVFQNNYHEENSFYIREGYSVDDALKDIEKMKREGLSKKKIKDKDRKLSEYMKSIRERELIEEQQNGKDGIDTNQSIKQLESLPVNVDKGFNYAGKRYEIA